MGLSFLVPAFLLGLLAIAIPIWVHLRNRPRQDTVDFPSLMFLEQIPYRAVQRQQLRHRALFALRCLALALLALAFARPFLGALDPAVGAVAGSREVVIALDRSWSMGYGNRWEAALDQARSAVAGLAATDRASLVLFDDSAEVRVRSSGDPASVRGAIDGLSPSQAVTDLGAGLRAAREILADSTLPVREVVLISDFQRSGWDAEADLEMPEGTTLRPVSVAVGPAHNVSVAGVTIEQTTVAETVADAVAVSARLARVGEGARAVEIRLDVRGAEPQTRSLTLQDSDAAVVAFDPVPVGEGTLAGTVSIGGDDLDGDDSFHFQVAPGQALSVLVLDHPRNGPADSLFLRRALGIGSRPAFRVERALLGDLDPVMLADRDLVVVNDPGSLDAGNASTLAGYVAGGGGLLVALGELTEGPGTLGGDDGLLPFATEIVDRTGDLGATLAYADTDHPAFEVFAAAGSGDLSAARFFRYHAIRSPPAEGVLARFDDGAPALLERRFGEGRVLLWTTTLDTFWNDFPLQPVFLPFVQRVARHAAAFREPRPWVDAARPLGAGDLLGSVGADAADATGITVDDRPLALEGGIRLEAGFHELAWIDGERSRSATLAVNLDRRESDLATVDPEEVAAAVVWRQGGEVEGEEETTPAIDVERSQSIWWYLVILAFLLLAAESILSNRLSSSRPPVAS